jgi:hypothetical protein
MQKYKTSSFKHGNQKSTNKAASNNGKPKEGGGASSADPQSEFNFGQGTDWFKMGGGQQTMARKSSKNLLGENPLENGLNPIMEEIELRENDNMKSKMSNKHLLGSGSGLMSPSDILNISDSDYQ